MSFDRLVRNLLGFFDDNADDSKERLAEIETRGKIVELDSSRQDGDNLTADEVLWITAKCCCPDCLHGRLLEGPSGGASLNFACNLCGSEFNGCFFPRPNGRMDLIGGERISDRGPRELGDRATLYPRFLYWSSL